MSEDFQQPAPPPGVSTLMAVVFYGILLAAAWALGAWWLDLDLLEWHDRWETAMWLDVALGVGLGLATVAASRVLERTTEWARVLGEEFREILGNLTTTQVLIFALTSGIAEEVFFRGFLQQALSELAFGNDWLGLIVASLIFGLIHIGPDRKKFLPWTIMAVVLGICFGVLYLYTGNIVAPVVAHFTINFFNLLHIARDDDEPSSASPLEAGEPGEEESIGDDEDAPWSP